MQTSRCSDADVLAIYIDGQRFGEHHVISAVGIDRAGSKHVLGIEMGATENAAAVNNLLTGLRDRGPPADRQYLLSSRAPKRFVQVSRRCSAASNRSSDAAINVHCAEAEAATFAAPQHDCLAIGLQPRGDLIIAKSLRRGKHNPASESDLLRCFESSRPLAQMSLIQFFQLKPTAIRAQTRDTGNFCCSPVCGTLRSPLVFTAGDSPYLTELNATAGRWQAKLVIGRHWPPRNGRL